MFKHEGLIAGVVEILGQKGSEYKRARKNAVAAINNIAYLADAEVKAGLFHFPELMSHIEAIIGDIDFNGTDIKDMALKLKKKIEHMGGGGQSNPSSTQSFGSSTAGSVRMEKEPAVMRTEQATKKSNLETVRTEQATMKSNLEIVRTEQAAMKSNLETVRTEQAAMKSNLETVLTEQAAMADSLFRVEKALATITSTLAPTETLDLTLSDPPPPADSTGNNKRSVLAILADNQASFNHTLKKVKKEKDDISRSLEALEDAETCTVCLAEKRGVLFLPCGHLVCCGECSEKVNECPMCRKVIRKRKTVFM